MVNEQQISSKTTPTTAWSIQVQLSEASMDSAMDAAEEFLKQFGAQEPSVPAMLLRELLMAIHRHAGSSNADKMIELQLLVSGEQKLKMVFKLQDYDFSKFLFAKNDSKTAGLSEREYLLIHSLSEWIFVSDERNTLVAEVSLSQGMNRFK